METLYVVQAFYGMGEGVVAAKPILHGMEQLARSRGEALAGRCDGVLVYAQGIDVDQGEYSNPVVLATYGNVPYPEKQSLRQHRHGPARGRSGAARAASAWWLPLTDEVGERRHIREAAAHTLAKDQVAPTVRDSSLRQHWDPVRLASPVGSEAQDFRYGGSRDGF